MFEVHIVQAEVEGEAKLPIKSRTAGRDKIKAGLRTRRDSTNWESEARACLGGDVIQKILCPHLYREE